MASKKLATRFEAYKVTNLVNGRLYIGITTYGIPTRWREHLYEARTRPKTAIHRAIAKHGEAAFSIELAGNAEDWEALVQLERTLIVAHLSLSPRGYNMTAGGDGLYRPTPDVRAAQSQRMRIHYASAEARAAQGEKQRKASASPELRALRGAAIKAAHSKPEARAANAERARARWASPEMRAKMVAGLKAVMASPEERIARTAAMFAFNRSPEGRAARSARARAQRAREKAERFAKLAAD